MDKCQQDSWSSTRTIALNSTRVRNLRKSAGFSQMALSLWSLGSSNYLSESTIKRAEAGKEVYLETATRLAALLGVELCDLVDGEKGPPKGDATSLSEAHPVTPVNSMRTTYLAPLQDATAGWLYWAPGMSTAESEAIAARPPSQPLVEMGVAYL